MRRALLGALLLAAAVALAGCGGTAGTGDKGYVAGDGVISRLPVAERDRPGPVSGTTLEGSRLALSWYAGKVVVVNVWGSWCASCRSEAGRLGEAADELKSDHVQFVGINTRDASPDQGLAYQKHFKVPYPSLFDPSGRSLLAFRGTLTPTAIPSTVVLDQRGRVAASILGEVPSTRTLVELVHDVSRTRA